MEVEIAVYDETIGMTFIETSNGENEICKLALFHDEFKSLRDVLTKTIEACKPPAITERVIAKDQMVLV